MSKCLSKINAAFSWCSRPGCSGRRDACTAKRPIVANRRKPCRGHLATLVLALLATAAPAAAASAADYLGPNQVVATKDGKTLYVLEVDAGQIAVVDPAAGKVLRTITPPVRPTGVAISADGGKLYVTCAAPEGSVAVIEAASGKVAATIPVGHTACGPALTPDGKRLYVCNRFNNNVSVIDLEANRELARLPVVREPVEAVVTPDGKSVFVANLLPNDRSDGSDVAATISVIDTASNQVSAIRLLERQHERPRDHGLARRQVRLRGTRPFPLPDAHHATGTGLDEHQRPDDPRRAGQEAAQHGALGRR